MIRLILEAVKEWVEELLNGFVKKGNAEDSKSITGRYNVLDFGLKGDGVTDNTQALQNMINRVPTGAVIFFPQGTYNITDTITINKSLYFIGDSIHKGGDNFDTPNSDSIISYAGTKTNVTLFKRTLWRPVSFKCLSFIGNAFTVVDNDNRPSTYPRPMYKDVTLKEGINGVDMNDSDSDSDSFTSFENCTFRGFSGFALKVGQHKYITNCSFSHCYSAIQATMDSIVENCWICRCHNGITSILSNKQRSGEASKYFTIIGSDIWADQLSGHFYVTENDTGTTTCFFDNVNIDLVDESVICALGGLMDGHINGKISRYAMSCENITEEEKTAELLTKCCVIYTKHATRMTSELVIYDTEDDRKLIESPQGEGLFRFATNIVCPRLSFNKVFGKNCRFANDQKNYHVYTKEGHCTHYGQFWYVNGKTEYQWGALHNILAPEVGMFCLDTRDNKWYMSTAADDKEAWQLVDSSDPTDIDFSDIEGV